MSGWPRLLALAESATSRTLLKRRLDNGKRCDRLMLCERPKKRRSVLKLAKVRGLGDQRADAPQVSDVCRPVRPMSLDS